MASMKRLALLGALAAGLLAVQLLPAAYRASVFVWRALDDSDSQFSWTQVSAGVFANNRGSSVLRADHPSSLKNMLQTWGDESYWGHMQVLESLRPGSPPSFELQTGGAGYWDWLDAPENAERSRTFNAAMLDASAALNAATLADYPWQRHANKTLSDIGGGVGGFLADLLHSQPGMRGLLVDRASVVAEAEKRWRQHHAKLTARVRMVAGNFFDHLPQADIHFLRYILHDWSDARTRDILCTAHAAIPPGSENCTVLLVQDIVVPDRSPGVVHTTMDLQMLSLVGGKERTRSEWEALLRSAGFRLTAVHPLRTLSSLIEARAL